MLYNSAGRLLASVVFRVNSGHRYKAMGMPTDLGSVSEACRFPSASVGMHPNGEPESAERVWTSESDLCHMSCRTVFAAYIGPVLVIEVEQLARRVLLHRPPTERDLKHLLFKNKSETIRSPSASGVGSTGC